MTHIMTGGANNQQRRTPGRFRSAGNAGGAMLVGQLRHKLGDEPTHPRFIVTVQGVGYRLAVPQR